MSSVSGASEPLAPLGDRARRGLVWSLTGMGATFVAQLALLTTMARLLTPADYGLMAMAMVAWRVFGLVAQAGVGPALIQRPDLNDEDLRRELAVTWLAGLAATLLLLVLAPMIGELYGDTDVVDVLRVAALGFVPSGLAALSLALLRRALRLKAVAAVELVAFVLGYGGAGVGAGMAGCGVWALVAAMLVQPAVSLLLSWALLRHPLWPSWRDARAPGSYGLRYSLVSLVELIAASLDSAVIGKLQGDAALGLYNRASMLAMLPAEKLAGAVSSVLFPLLSRIQGNLREVGAVSLLGLAAVGSVTAAVAAGTMAGAEELVLVLLGQKWVDSVPLLRVLACACVPMYMNHICGVICDATAMLTAKLRLQLAALVLYALLLAGLAERGAIGVAMAVAIVESVRMAAYLSLFGRHLSWAWHEVARVLGAVVVCGAGVGGAVFAVAQLGRDHAAAASFVLALEVVAGGLALAATATLACRLLADTSAARLAGRNFSLPRLWRRRGPAAT